MRRGQIRRSYLSDSWQLNPVWGHSWPVYIPLVFQVGPGKTRDLNFYWSLEWDAVSAERR